MNFQKRIARILLLARCIIRAVFHDAVNQVPAKLSKVIVVPAGKLGDVVCTTPVLSAIRAYAPQAHIIVTGNLRLHRMLLADSGLANAYLDLEGADTLARIKECSADAAIVTGPAFDSTALFYLAGIPLVIAPKVEGGISPNETRPYKILQHFIKLFPYRMGEYAPRERLRALEPLGIFSDDTSKHLGFSEVADKTVQKFFSENGIDPEKDFVVGISPSAGNKIKEWPEERFAEVTDYLSVTYGAKVLLIGGSGDKEKVMRVKDLLKPETKVTEATGFNLDELKALISKLELFISVDTGPIYIAEAFGIPTIDITGPIDEREQPPRGPLHRNVVPPQRSRPELFVLNAKIYDREEALRQVRSITVSLVKKEIDLLITDIKRQT